MSPSQTTALDNKAPSPIRDAGPSLDLLAIRSLRRAGFQIIRQEPESRATVSVDHPMPRSSRDMERPQGSSF